MVDLGILSPDEERLSTRLTDRERISVLSGRRPMFFELGTPQTNGYGYIRRDLGEFQVGVYDWKRNETAEISFNDFRLAMDFLLANGAFAP